MRQEKAWPVGKILKVSVTRAQKIQKGGLRCGYRFDMGQSTHSLVHHAKNFVVYPKNNWFQTEILESDSVGLTPRAAQRID